MFKQLWETHKKKIITIGAIVIIGLGLFLAGMVKGCQCAKAQEDKTELKAEVVK